MQLVIHGRIRTDMKMQIKSNLISELSQRKIDQTQKSNPETNDQTYRLRRCDPKMQDTNFGEKRTN